MYLWVSELIGCYKRCIRYSSRYREESSRCNWRLTSESRRDKNNEYRDFVTMTTNASWRFHFTRFELLHVTFKNPLKRTWHFNRITQRCAAESQRHALRAAIAAAAAPPQRGGRMMFLNVWKNSLRPNLFFIVCLWLFRRRFYTLYDRKKRRCKNRSSELFFLFFGKKFDKNFYI